MKKFLVLNVLALLLFGQVAMAQTTIRGTVKGSDGEAIPGANISVKSTTFGTITGADGTYTISAPSNATLVFSFIGYQKQEIPVDGRSTIDAVLKEETEQIGEVVITALGIKTEKKRLGYSTQEVTGNEISEIKDVNVMSTLTGKVSGLTVQNKTGLFQSPSYTLRGKTPLIVLDGIPISTDFYDIQSEDIESINVLKGTAASALYGSRGKDGAIMITTKTAGKEKLEISISNSEMFSAGFVAFPDVQSEYGDGADGQYKYVDGTGNGIHDDDLIWGPKLDQGQNIVQWNSPIKNIQTGELIEWRGALTGTIYEDATKYERVATPWVSHPNNLKNFLETGIVSNSNFSVSSSSDKGSFRVSGSHMYQKGMVPNSKLNSSGINFSSQYKLMKNLTFDAKLSYDKVYTDNYPRHGYGPLNHMYTIIVWMGDDVDVRDMKNYWMKGRENYQQANWNSLWYNNPYFMAEECTQGYDRNVMNGNMSLNYQVLPELSIQARGNVRSRFINEDRKTPKSYLYYGNSLLGNYEIWKTTDNTYDYDVLATYTKSVSENFSLDVFAGGAVSRWNYDYQYSTTDGIITGGLFNLGNSLGPVSTNNKEKHKETRSVYGSLNLELFKFFYGTVSGRNDWSSTLPTNNNNYFYPSVSGSFVFDDIIDLPSWMKSAKLRTTWAQVSTDLDAYSLYNTYTNTGMYNSTPGMGYPSSLLNSNIKPAQSTSWEIGGATSLFNNRVNMDVTYYNVIDKNQIIDLPVSLTSGFGSQKVNGNVYKTTGLEVMMNVKPIYTSKVKWDMNINWFTNKKVLSEIYGGASKYGNLHVGERVDSYYGTVWQKSPDGQTIINQSSGLPIKDTYSRKLGHTGPNWEFGINNSVKFGKWELAALFDGRIGGIIRSLTIEKMWWGGKHPESVQYRDAEYAGQLYVPDGVYVASGDVNYDSDGNITSDTRVFAQNEKGLKYSSWAMTYGYRAKEMGVNIFDASFVKLREASVKYDCTALFGGSFIKEAYFQVMGRNLLMVKKAKLIDPDFGNDDSLQDPSARYLGFGFGVKF
ncbi:MAG: SusC/RagA family TonB-linked outer membrane protein [Prolixibacteraceae bacterium]|jgi:TonB-linked SusC/RagA family outer membrane protein